VVKRKIRKLILRKNKLIIHKDINLSVYQSRNSIFSLEWQDACVGRPLTVYTPKELLNYLLWYFRLLFWVTRFESQSVCQLSFMKDEVLWVVTPCSAPVGYRHFWGTFLPPGPPKRRYPNITPYGVTSQKASSWISTAVKTWDLVSAILNVWLRVFPQSLQADTCRISTSRPRSPLFKSLLNHRLWSSSQLIPVITNLQYCSL